MTNLEKQERHPNFRSDDGRLFLVRCFVCGGEYGKENYAMAVADGTCAWCGWNESQEKGKVNMKIAFDFHGVIEKYPEIFSHLMQAFRAMGAEVFVISGPTLEQIKCELGNSGYKQEIHYDEVYSVVDFLKNAGVKMWKDDAGNDWAEPDDWWGAKSLICDELNVSVMIDDSEEYERFFEDKNCVFCFFQDCNFQDMLVQIVKSFTRNE